MTATELPFSTTSTGTTTTMTGTAASTQQQEEQDQQHQQIQSQQTATMTKSIESETLSSSPRSSTEELHLYNREVRLLNALSGKAIGGSAVSANGEKESLKKKETIRTSKTSAASIVPVTTTSTTAASSSNLPTTTTNAVPAVKAPSIEAKPATSAKSVVAATTTKEDTTTAAAAASSSRREKQRRPPAKAATAKAMFSSNQEEPITMSPATLASVKQEIHFAEEDDEETALPLEVRIHPSLPTTSSSKPSWLDSIHQAIKRCDFSYSTSSLTRNSYSISAPTTPTTSISTTTTYLLGMIMQDFIAKLTFQSPLNSPFVFYRILKLLWNGGPNINNYYSVSGINDLLSPPNSNNNLPNYLLPYQQQQQDARSQPPATVEGIPNYGQTCFLNAVLQSFASLDSVLAYTQWIATEQQRQQQQQQYSSQQNSITRTTTRHHHHHKKKKKKSQQTTTTVSQLLLPLLQGLNGQIRRQRRQVLDPRELLWRIAQKNPQFQTSRHQLFGFAASCTGEQQDAQELLQALLEMMIIDAHLDDDKSSSTGASASAKPTSSSDTTQNRQQQQLHIQPIQLPSQQYGGGGIRGILDHFNQEGEEKKNDDDEVLTVLSDRWAQAGVGRSSAASSQLSSPQNSSSNSLCSSTHGGAAGDEKQQQQQQQLSSAWQQVHMIDSNGVMASYERDMLERKKKKKEEGSSGNGSGDVAKILGGLSSSIIMSSSTSSAAAAKSQSLESSFLSTTSTVVTSGSRSRTTTMTEQEQDQPPPPPQLQLSGSMQIMLSTISPITKTPLSCWTGSLVQCQKCYHNRAVRNQEWRDIPIVPTALSGLAIINNNKGSVPSSCTLKECLRNFTQVERVTDVECGNCTLQRDIQQWQEEVDLLRGAVQALEQRQRKQQNQQQQQPTSSSSTSSGAAGGVRKELEQAEFKLWKLQQQDPDEYDPKTYRFSSAEEDSEADAEAIFAPDSNNSQQLKLLRADALKCLVLTRLPSVLCLHVQRRFYDPVTDRMSKTLQHVQFDELLDVAPYCAYGGGNANAESFFASQMKNHNNNNLNTKKMTSLNANAKPIWYRLTSVIVHQGNAFGGHYVCYRRLPTHLQQQQQQGGSSSNQKWYYCSDNTIQLTTWDHVKNSQAYMLFYEAI